ncbi:MAG: hypothetical protein H0W73_12850 [Bacteroidetes bacterium]|nr:hypothetical protein [Bacteroidota bacterium]
MKLLPAKLILIFSFLMVYATSNAQEPNIIKVKKESDLVKVVFDNVDLKLMAVDRFGNPRQNRVVSYKLWIKGKGETKMYPGFNNSLSPEMIKELNKLKKATKIFFTEINVKEEDDHSVKLPDVIDTWFPDCKNCDNKQKGY